MYIIDLLCTIQKKYEWLGFGSGEKKKLSSRDQIFTPNKSHLGRQDRNQAKKLASFINQNGRQATFRFRVV